ncbi:MAG: rod shape-determining protein MreC [Planctomycetota bacterium]
MHIRVSKRMLFVWFTLAALILLLTPQKITGRLQFAFARFFHWPLRISRVLSLSVQSQKSRSQIKEIADYNQLKNHIEQLKELYKQEHQKVEQLAKYRDRLPLAGVGLPFAGIISSTINRTNGKLVIDRGQNDGLANGQFVMADNSIIGIISQIAPRTAQISLASDPTFKIPVIIADLNVNRVMIGIGSNLAKIQLLETKYKINVGDFIKVQLPGLDGPMVIGKIKHFKRDSQQPHLWDVIVEPACSIENLQFVNVIILNPEQ